MRTTVEQKRIVILLIVYLVISVLFVWNTGLHLGSDAQFFIEKAEESIALETYYPSFHNQHDWKVHNPGFVNYLILLKKSGLSIKAMLLLNIVLNCFFALVLYMLAKRIFRKPLYGLLVIFVLFPRSYALNMDLNSEVPALLLAYLALYLFIGEENGLILLSGFFIAAANYIRPVAFFFVPALVIYVILRDYPVRKLMLFFLSFFITILIIGSFSYFNSGYFIFQSVSIGEILISGANPEADGKDISKPFQKGKIGYIPDPQEMTVLEKDRFWRDQAIGWIVKNPLDYVALYFKKIFLTYQRDSWGINRLTNTEQESDQIAEFPGDRRFFWYLAQWYNQIVYVLIVLFGLLAVTKLNPRHDSILLFLIIFCVTLLTGLLLGNPRFKYPAMPAFLMLAAYSVHRLLEGRPVTRIFAKRSPGGSG